MPALFHLVLHAFFGSLLAWSSRGAPRARARLTAWPLFFGLAYAVAVLLPICAYQFRFYPDFSLSYAFDPVLFPWAEQDVTALGLAACSSYVLALVCGYTLTRAGLLRSRWLLALLVPMAATAAGVWGCLAFGSRSLALAGYDDYWRGLAVPWMYAPSGMAAIAAYVVALMGLRLCEKKFRSSDPGVLGQL